MTPKQKLKRQILLEAIELNDDLNWDGEITVDNVDDAWENVLVSKGIDRDFLEDYRFGQYVTDIPCDYSRHYESKSVACQLNDGTWIGWTYWYGGGKHGNPESIDWLSGIYELDCVEEEKLVVIRSFSKKNG